MILKNFFLVQIVILLFGFFVFAAISKAQDATTTPTPAPTSGPSESDLQNKIKEYQQKISELQGKGKTLSSQISIMANQIKLTEFRIADTKQKIADLEKDIAITKDKVSGLEKDISYSTKAMVGRVAAVYQVGRVDPWEVFLTSKDLTNLFTRLKYLKLVQEYDKKNIYAAEQAKVDYSNQKTIFEEKEKEAKQLNKKLEDYTNELNQEKIAQQNLLAATKNDEARYQKLLQDAQAQISAFKTFSSVAGGSSILPAQPSPDGWYYNQRDERWGRNTIGSSGDQVWDVGCLLTSVAMVLKEHGQGVTPAGIAGNSSYFFSNTAYMLLPWGGGSFTSIWGNNQADIDGKLSSGEPVIVGVRAGIYGQHFIVLKSGSGGNYIMNDPWYGPNLNFTDHYSSGQIFQYGWYKG